jgi:class 3 adenylate cyclase/WD40 repeat protein
MPASATATFLFCDLVGSTALLTRIGDDAGDDVRRRCFGVFREAVADYRGSEVKTMGDGMLVMFATSVGDAIGCGIAMQRGVARLDRESPLLGLRLRVGVAVGEAGSEDGDWFGTPVVEAARLCAAARSGQILVADLARQLVGSRGAFRFTSLGAMELKGLGAVSVAEVAWEPEPGTSVTPLPAALEVRAQLPFVGRRNERDQLEAAWGQVQAGQLRVVAVTGERGIGKTALVAESARAIRDRGAIVLYGRCRVDTDEPYEPFAEALAWYVATTPEPELRAQLGPFGGELVRIVPSLLTRFADLPRPDGGSDGARGRLFDAVAGVLTAAASASPVMLVLDDLDAAPPLTFALLDHLTDVGRQAALLIVAIAAVFPDQPAPMATRRANSHTQVLALGGLSDTEVTLLVSTATGRPVGEIAAEARALRDETDGNPALLGQLLAQTDGADLGGLSLPCPYKGLAAFQPEDHEVFFGRDEVVAGLLARLAATPLLGVVGASGSGKSSVVRAGLLPALGRGALPGSSAWRTLVMAPGSRPLTELAAQLAVFLHRGPAGLLSELEADRRALDLDARQLLVGANPNARVLVVVDQLEELFTICDDAIERDRFIDALLYAVGAPGARTSAVVVLRADFYGAAAGTPGLAAALENNHILLGPMRDDELRAAVERPARHVGLRLEPGLVDAVVTDVTDQPGGLPLLSHALLETWKGRDGRTLTVAAYRAVGGARGAIARSADTALAAMNPEQQQLAKHIFLRLVEIGDGIDDTSRRAQLSELNPDDDPIVADVLQGLIDARLLTANEATIEIAHEALIRGWPQLRDWLDEDREGLRLLTHLRSSAHEWERLDHDPAELQRGARLAATLDWVATAEPPLDDTERRYLDAARNAEQAELATARRSARRSRTMAVGLAALLAMATVSGLVTLDQRQHAQHEAHRADTAARDAARAARTAEIGQLLQLARNPTAEEADLALLAGVQVHAMQPSNDSEGALESALANVPPGLDGLLHFGFATPSPDGRWLAAPAARKMFDLRSSQAGPGAPFPFAGTVATFSADGREMAVGSTGGVVDIVDVPNGGIGAGLPQQGTYVYGIFDPVDRAIVYTVSDAGEVIRWDRHDPAHVTPDRHYRFTPQPGNPIITARLSDDGRLLVVTDASTAGGTTRVWDVSRDTPLRDLKGLADDFLPHTEILVVSADNEIDFLDARTGQPQAPPIRGFDEGGFGVVSPDGQRLATADDVGGVRVFDLATRQQIGPTLPTPSSLPTGFLPDGRLVVSNLNITFLWRVGTTVAPFGTVLGGPTEGTHGWFVDDGARVLTMGDDAHARLWDAATGSRVGEIPDLDNTSLRDVSPDGRLAVVALPDGTLRLIDASSGARLGTIASRPAAGSGLGFAPDGTLLATVDGRPPQRIVLWDVSDPRSPRETGQLYLPPRPPGSSSGSVLVNFSRDGRLLAARDLGSSTITLYDVPSRTRRWWRTLRMGQDAIAPDGTVALVTSDASGDRVLFLDAEHGLERGSVAVPEATGVAYVRGAGILAVTGAFGNTSGIQLYDAGTREPIGEPLAVGTGTPLLLSTSADGNRLLSSSADGVTILWDLDVGHWTDTACRIAGRNFTRAEWNQYLPDQHYQRTCPQWPEPAA